MRYLFIISALILLFSCRSSKQNRTEESSTADSVKVVTNDSSVTNIDKSVTKKENDLIEEDLLDIQLEFRDPADKVWEQKTEPRLDGTGELIDSNSPFIELADSTTLAWLGIALENPRLKSIKVKGKRMKKDNTKTITENNIVNSAHKSNSDSTNVSNESSKKNNKVETEQFSIWKLFPWFVWLILVVVALILIRLAYRRFISPLIKTKDKMKNIFFIAISIAFLMSCNNPNQEPNGERIGVQSGEPEVHLELTLGQSFYFAFKDGYALPFGLGLIALGGAIFLLVKGSDKLPGKKNPTSWALPVTGALTLLGLVLILAKPLGIRWYEGVWVTKDLYENEKKADALKSLWEDKYKMGRIKGTSKPK